MMVFVYAFMAGASRNKDKKKRQFVYNAGPLQYPPPFVQAGDGSVEDMCRGYVCCLFIVVYLMENFVPQPPAISIPPCFVPLVRSRGGFTQVLGHRCSCDVLIRPEGP